MLPAAPAARLVRDPSSRACAPPRRWIQREHGPDARANAARAATRQFMCWPPLIAMLEPVTKPASSEHRYATSAATSSG